MKWLLTLSTLAVISLAAAGAFAADAPPQIQAVQDFLLGLGKGNWEPVAAQAAGKIAVKVGGTDYAVDPEAKKADVQLRLPFKGLSTVREAGKVKAVTVDEIAVKAGTEEKKGKATVSLEEKDGKFLVTGISIE
jgi:hypothetical protein